MAERVVHGRLCISCYNREREAVGPAGLKAKSKPGIRALRACLAHRDLVVLADGVATPTRTPLVRDMREAIATVASKVAAGAIGRPSVTWPDEVAA